MKDDCWLPFLREDVPETLCSPPDVARWELRGQPCELIREPDWNDAFSIEETKGRFTLRGGDTGLLYAAYHWLMARRAGRSAVRVRQAPEHSLRMLNHWDNMTGQIERGYAGRSLWFEGGAVAYDAQRLRQYARLLASVGINAICLNNVNVVAPAHQLIDEAFLPAVAALARLFATFGVRLLLSVDYAMPTYAGLPTADPLDEGVQRWWQRQCDLVYRHVPNLLGFLVKADSEHRPGPFTYGRDHAQGANLLARALKPHNGVLIWRCFVYNCKQDWRDEKTDRAMAAFQHYAHLDGRFEDNVILQIKNGPMDFQVREPVSPLLLAMPRTRKALELQLAQEYTGQQVDLYAMRGAWDEIFADLPAGAVSAIAAVANTGRDRFLTGHPFAQFNLFAYGRAAWKREREFADELELWARLSYDLPDDKRALLRDMLLHSREAYQMYNAPLGLGWMVQPNHHYGPSPMGYEYAPWGTYHRANRDAVGVDRTANGTGYLLQYPSELQARYADLKTCPDDLLLFFHRLPYAFRMKDNRTLVQRVYDDHYEGAAMTKAFSDTLRTLRGSLPDDVQACAEERMERQLINACEWRDQINDFFHRMSGISDEKGRL